MHHVEKRQIFWEPIIASVLLLASILGTMVPLYIHSDNKTAAQIEAIRQDIKTFQERLIRIEERRKN